MRSWGRGRLRGILGARGALIKGALARLALMGMLAPLLSAGARAENALETAKRGSDAYARGDSARALEYFQEALEEAAAHGNKREMMLLHFNIGSTQRSLSEIEDAREHYRAASSLAQELGNVRMNAEALKWIARTYTDRGDDAQAAAYCKQSAALYHRMGDAQGERECRPQARAPRTNGDQGGGRSLDSQLAAARETGDKRDETRVLREIAAVWQRKNDRRSALAIERQALAAAETLGDDELLGLVHLGIAADLYELGADRDASTAFEAAARAFERSGSRKDQAVALTGECGALIRLKDYTRAENDCARGLALFEDLKAGDGQVAALDTSMTLEMKRRNYPRALDYGRRALAGARSMGDRKSEGAALQRLANVHYTLGDYHQALGYNQDALQICRDNGNRACESECLIGIGTSYAGFGDYYSALDSFMAARRLIQPNESGPDAIDWMDIGAVHMLLGHHSEALKYFEQGLNAARRGGSLEIQRNIELDMGDAYLGLGDKAQARELYEKYGDQTRLANYWLSEKQFGLARDILEKNLPYMERSLEVAAIFANYAYLGRAYEGLKDYRRAAAYYQRGIDLAERVRSRLPVEERMYFFEMSELNVGRMEPYEGMVRVAPQMPAGIDGSFARAESTKNRAFAELSARQNGASANAGALNAGPAPADIPLAPGEVLVEYAVTAPYTKVFVLKSGRIVHSFDVPATRDELAALVNDYRGNFEKVQGADQLAAFRTESGRKLYDLLLRPVLDSGGQGIRAVIAKSERIILVPDGPLRLLPFEALVTNAPGRLVMPSGAHGPVTVGVSYLADDYDISYSPSAAALSAARAIKRTRRPPRDMFVLADPVFSESDPRSRDALARMNIRPNAQFLRPMGLGGRVTGLKLVKAVGTEEGLFARLDKTSILAAQLSRDGLAADPVDVLSGMSAAKPLLLNRNLAEYRNLVFATHGILNGMLPGISEPALVLTQVGLVDLQDGFLTMSEVMRMRLNADVVALIACQTGLGRQVSGEGVLGLGRAFQYAGAKHVMVSLWNVDEQSTTNLTERFFAHVREGKSPRLALKESRLDIRREGYDHPFYWAPFTLIGE